VNDGEQGREFVPHVTAILILAESGATEQYWSVRQGTEKQ